MIGPSTKVDEFKRNFEKSMGYLDLVYLDNLDFHGPGNLAVIRPAMRDDGCLGYVRRLMSEGVIRHFGFSTHEYPNGVLDLANTTSLNQSISITITSIKDYVMWSPELAGLD